MKYIKDLCQLITLESAHQKDGRKLIPEDLCIINDGAIVYDSNKILWVGESKNIPSEYSKIDAVSKKGHILTPEIVDSHTHLVFGGDRSFEYTMRLNGADYQDIANTGGGILLN